MLAATLDKFAFLVKERLLSEQSGNSQAAEQAARGLEELRKQMMAIDAEAGMKDLMGIRMKNVTEEGLRHAVEKGQSMIVTTAASELQLLAEHPVRMAAALVEEMGADRAVQLVSIIMDMVSDGNEVADRAIAEAADRVSALFALPTEKSIKWWAEQGVVDPKIINGMEPGRLDRFAAGARELLEDLGRMAQMYHNGEKPSFMRMNNVGILRPWVGPASSDKEMLVEIRTRNDGKKAPNFWIKSGGHLACHERSLNPLRSINGFNLSQKALKAAHDHGENCHGFTFPKPNRPGMDFYVATGEWAGDGAGRYRSVQLLMYEHGAKLWFQDAANRRFFIKDAVVVASSWQEERGMPSDMVWLSPRLLLRDEHGPVYVGPENVSAASVGFIYGADGGPMKKILTEGTDSPVGVHASVIYDLLFYLHGVNGAIVQDMG